MNQNKQRKQLGLLLGLLLLLSALLGYGTRTRYPSFFKEVFNSKLITTSTATQTIPIQVDWGKFEEIKGLVDNLYNGPIIESKLLEGALKGMVNSLEGGGQFFNAREFHEIQNRSEKSRGTGIHLGVQDGLLVVLRTDDNSQGFKSGILPGDLILKINDRIYSGDEIETAQNLMLSDNRTSVKLHVLRGSEQREVKVHLRLLTPQPIRGMMYQDAAIVAIPNFNDGIVEEFDRILNNLTEAGAKSLILDLRDLPSGNITEAVQIAARFISKGEPVMAIRDTKGKQRLFVSDSGTFSDLPLVVLINERTEGTAEFVAGALQQLAKAKLIGQKTMGEARVHSYIALPEGEGIKLVTAYFLLPNDGEIHGQGIEPSVLIPSNLRHARNLVQMNDLQMKKAIEKAVELMKK